MFGDRNAVAGMQPRHADPSAAADIEIDPVDAGAELLDEAKPPGLGQQFFRHRGRHDECDVRVAQYRRARGQGAFFDERTVQFAGTAASIAVLMCG